MLPGHLRAAENARFEARDLGRHQRELDISPGEPRNQPGEYPGEPPETYRWIQPEIRQFLRCRTARDSVSIERSDACAHHQVRPPAIRERPPRPRLPGAEHAAAGKH